MAAKSKSKKQKEEESPDTEVVTMEEVEEPEVSIEDLPGVGPATAENYVRPDSMNYWHSQ